ncbi:Gag-Pol polyprotein [Plecturocebus cupreus]
MNTKGHHWLTNARLTKYLSLLSENPHIFIEVCNTLNPATSPLVSEGPVKHICVEVLDSVYSSRPDLRDQQWTVVDWELCVDRGSFANPQGERCAGYAVVTLDTVIGTVPLPQEGRTVLTQAPELSEDKTENFYINSQFAFLTLQIHGVLYKEKGLLNSGGKGLSPSRRCTPDISPIKSYIIGPLPYCRHSWEFLGMWIKDWNAVPLKPWWKGPQTVILTTPTAVKVEGVPAWIHTTESNQQQLKLGKLDQTQTMTTESP